MQSKKIYVKPTLITGEILSEITAKSCGASGLPPCPSDIRLKRDIDLIGRSQNGFNIYSYCYIWSDQRYVGVMAQEVQASKPDAVVKGEDGFLRVKYNKLGLKLQTWEQWKEEHKTIH